MNKFSKPYIELLKYAKSLEKNGISLEKQDKGKYRKLLNYSLKLANHLHWQKKMIICV